MTSALCKINDVQERALSLNDLLNVEFVNDSLKKFDEAPGRNRDGTGKRNQKRIFPKAFTTDSWRSRLSC